MSDQSKYEYINDADSLHVVFDDDETREIYEVAEWYAAMVRVHGGEPPPTPMHCILKAARAWMSAVELGRAEAAMQAAGERKH